MMSSSSNKGGADLMTDAKKFLFDNRDFGDLKTKAAALYTEEQLTLAKTQSFASGKLDGAKGQEGRMAEILQKILVLAEKLAQAEERREVEKCADATKLAIKIVHKLMPQFAQQHALPEIEQVIIKSIEARRDEPRVAVTVPTVHLETLKARMDELALEKNYAGKVILVADDALAPTDCRVEWADGGAERIYERLFSQIDNEFTKALGGMNALLEQEKK
jgi:flagellar assembly protein FliH